MKSDEILIKWLKLTADLIQKYNLSSLTLKLEHHMMGLETNKVMFKDLLKINIKDHDNKYVIKNEYFDLHINEDKEVK